MELSSYLFLFVFFPLVFLIYLFIPIKYKKWYLIVTSLIFLFSFSIEIAISLFVFLIANYCISMNIKNNKKRLFVGIVFNILVIIYYKYTDFFITNFNMVFKTSIPLLNLISPIGLSFIVFQNISFLVDSYKGMKKGDFVDYLLYSFYFPRVVNGPIIRFDSFRDEIKKLSNPSVDNVFEGIRRITFGLGKVFILSNVMGNIWQKVYDSLSTYGVSVSIAILGIICYSFYLFLNFSGFIDMSVGISKLFNINIPENFNYPYLADSISNFWRRWHITLSSWFRDYVYIPLGGNRKGNVYIHLMIVFILTGLWHGGSWNFIIWGIYNGIIIVIERMIRNNEIYKKIPKTIKVFFTYVLVVIGWVFFASNGIKASVNYLSYLIGLKSVSMLQYDISYFLSSYNILFILLSVIVSFGVFDKVLKLIKNEKTLNVVYGLLTVIIFSITIFFIINNTYVPSIYANF